MPGKKVIANESELREKIHRMGVEKFGVDWFQANRRAVDAIAVCGEDPQKFRTIAPAIVLKVMSYLKVEQERIKQIGRNAG